jgi:hypothetical protein
MGENDFRRAVSRILSSSKDSRERIICLSSQYPGPIPRWRKLERAAPWSPIWPCTRWGFPCLRACAWSGGLLLHLFTLTLRRFQIANLKSEIAGVGGLFSVALSVGMPLGIVSRVYPEVRFPPWRDWRLQVTRHRALWCSDFPPPSRKRDGSDPPPFQNRMEYNGPCARRQVSKSQNP